MNMGIARFSEANKELIVENQLHIPIDSVICKGYYLHNTNNDWYSG